jgi:hypothetical protein
MPVFPFKNIMCDLGHSFTVNPSTTFRVEDGCAFIPEIACTFANASAHFIPGHYRSTLPFVRVERKKHKKV